MLKDLKLVDEEDNLEIGAEEMEVSPKDVKLPKSKDEEDKEDKGDNNTSEKEEITGEDILSEVDKRKLINNITQGSARNVHRLIHLYKNKIDEINPKLFNIMDSFIKSQEAFEWDPNNLLLNQFTSPGEFIKDMMNGYAKVDFKDEDNNEKESEDLELEDYKKATLKARAVDIVILLHESVKAIYEMIATAGIPEDEEVAKTVMGNTDSLDDEFEDLRYGVYIRRDLLEFVSENPALIDIENGFEYVWGRLVELPASDFVDLFKAMLVDDFKNRPLKIKVRVKDNRFQIISGTSRQIIDTIIEFIIEEFEEYEKQLKEYEEEQDDSSEDWKQ